MLTFNGKYLLLAAALLLIEVLIALFVKDRFFRPFVGDVLVVALIYCLCRAFVKASAWNAALTVFLLACLVEILQYFDYAALLHLENNPVLSVILGRTFEWLDFAAYLTGFLIVVLCEKIFDGRQTAG